MIQVRTHTEQVFERAGVSYRSQSVLLLMLVGVLTMTAVTQQTPPDHCGGYNLQQAELVAEAETYDEALRQIEGQLQAGWRILFVCVDRGGPPWT